MDRDSDGIGDQEDAFPDNPYEYIDTDGDGMGDNLDPDADDDGTPDQNDSFPLDATESMDTDGDGTGDNADQDDDADGVPDAIDAFPLNFREYLDTDGDGIGNSLDEDDNANGIPDDLDLYFNLSAQLELIDANLSAANQSLQGRIDILDAELAGANRSILEAIAGLRTDFMAELGEVNASLTQGIQDVLDALSTELGGLSTSLDGITSWLQVIDQNLTETNETLHIHLSDLERMSSDYYMALEADLVNLSVMLGEVEGNLTEDIDTIGILVQTLMDQSLATIMDRIEVLEENLSKVDDELAALLAEIKANLTVFQDEVEMEFEAINETLDQLVKLDNIMSLMGQLKTLVEQAREDLEAVDETLDDESAKSNLHTALLIVILILCLIILVVNFFRKGATAVETPGPDPIRPGGPQPKVDWEEVESLPER
jgi:archaellum component FlaC